MKRRILAIFLVIIFALVLFLALNPFSEPPDSASILQVTTNTPTSISTAPATPHPLSIEGMRQGTYPGSDIVIEERLLPDGINYKRYYVSYFSEDNLKIFALLTIPHGKQPPTGWPVIFLNHGYIDPEKYRTTQKYEAHVDLLARSGYIVFKSDYRGHDKSEGIASGGYSHPGYTIDVLNAVASIKRFPDADPNRMGMWGHSMGGHVTLRVMLTNKDIKAGVIWAGVVASYPDLFTRWDSPTTTPGVPTGWGASWYEAYGTPEENPEFWTSISPIDHIGEVSGPIRLHHGTNDKVVPILFSELLYEQAQNAGVNVKFYQYDGDNHNISISYNTAMQRSVNFFDCYVKNLQTTCKW